jgi:hypothetical protein
MVTKARLPEAERHWLGVLGTLNEAQPRVFVAQKALEEGRGFVSRLAQLTGMSRPTILKGMAELRTGRLTLGPETGRLRAAGVGASGSRRPILTSGERWHGWSKPARRVTR